MDNIIETMIKTKLTEYTMSYVTQVMDNTGLSQNEATRRVLDLLKVQLEAKLR